MLGSADGRREDWEIRPESRVPAGRVYLSFIYLEDRAVNSSISIDIFHGQGVVFLMGKETDDSATSERSRSLPDLRRRSADLLALAAQKHTLNRSDLYLCAGLASCSNRNTSS